MQNSLILLPVFAYILLTLVFYRGANIQRVSEALVKGHLVLFLFIAISTEVLSALNKITFSVLLIAWLIFLLVSLVAVFKRQKEYNSPLPISKEIAPITVILVGAIAFILVTTFITAIVYPPNNWDSMTYHMPRVLHWINNNNVSFYPTAITRQNYQMPLAEFAIMHLQILTGGDWYANLVQWMSFLVLICLGVVVAEELGLDKKLQLITAIIIATLPMAVLQASSTQNDLVASVFLMSFALFMLRLRVNFSVENLIFATICLGLALLTKGTAYIYGAALGLSLAAPVLLRRRQHLPRFLKAAVALTLVVIFALALNTGHLWRNYQLYGHPMSTEVKNYRNQDMSVTTLASNILRNGALHLGTPSEQINAYQLRLLHLLVGEQLNDPNTTWAGTTFRIPFSNHEDSAGNLIHMLITVFAVVLLFIAGCRGHHKKLVWYSIGLMLGAILYCWVLQWQPWASRLHTPLFALAAPLLAITITSGLATIRIGYLISLVMVLYSLPFVLGNSSRSIVSLEWKNIDRQQLYFLNRYYLYSDYKSAMNVLGVKGNGEVGLYLGIDDWEYPIWVYASRMETTGRSFTFRSVGVSNISRTINEELFLPSHVIATKPIESWEHASKYVPIFNSNHISVLKKLGITGKNELLGINPLVEGEVGGRGVANRVTD